MSSMCIGIVCSLPILLHSLACCYFLLCFSLLHFYQQKHHIICIKPRAFNQQAKSEKKINKVELSLFPASTIFRITMFVNSLVCMAGDLKIQLADFHSVCGKPTLQTPNWNNIQRITGAANEAKTFFPWWAVYDDHRMVMMLMMFS